MIYANDLRSLVRKGAVLFVLGVIVLLVIRFIPKTPLSHSYSSSTAIYDSQDKLLRLSLSSDDKYRLWIPLKEISPLLIEAVMLHEDRHFYWHVGVNPKAMIRAFWQTYIAQGRKQGGSTITMQLARKHYRIHTRTWTGKVKQMLRALQLELFYSKDEILEAYLNLVPFNKNIEGVAAATLIYFNKRPNNLTLPEALALAVIPQSPMRRAGNEALFEARAVLYRNWVKHRPQAREQQGLMALPLVMRDSTTLPFQAPHLTELLLSTRHHSSQINSTLDLRLQRTLERHIDVYIKQQGRIGIHNAAAMLVDTRSMEVKALVGSGDFFSQTIQGQVNGTLAKRSPGSALKPFVYALGIDQGLIHPLTILKDVPTAFGPFSPENFDGDFLGPITAKEALIRSRNIPAVSVSARLTQPSLYQFLKNAGITRLQPEQHYGLALVLGGGEVTMEELVTLYALLANRGVLKPLRYKREDKLSEGVRLLSEEASFMVLDMLKDNPRPNWGFIRQGAVSTLPVYWKTGTSWGFRDAWSVGIAGPYVLAVWIGNFDGSSNLAFVGLQAAAPLLFQIIDSLKAEQPDLIEPQFRFPVQLTQVEVCAASGDLPNPLCPLRSRTWFIPGKSPIKISQIHRQVVIDIRTGRQACPPYDPATIRKEVYEFWPSDMLRLFQLAGIPRRTPPPRDRDCAAFDTEGMPPQITSPLRGVTYTLRLSKNKQQPIALQTTTDASAAEVFWFANENYIGKTNRGQAFLWLPTNPGQYTLRVVDDQGRSDVRDLKVAVEK